MGYGGGFGIWDEGVSVASGFLEWFGSCTRAVVKALASHWSSLKRRPQSTKRWTILKESTDGFNQSHTRPVWVQLKASDPARIHQTTSQKTTELCFPHWREQTAFIWAIQTHNVPQFCVNNLKFLRQI